MTRDGDSCGLFISGVNMKMSGTYKCQAENTAGTATCSATVSVVGKKTWMGISLMD